MKYPNDADGDVLRRFDENGFDFSQTIEIEFIIDFNHWPLNLHDIDILNDQLPNVKVIDSSEISGYVIVTLTSKLTYDFVVDTQKQLTEKMKKIGGWCECWGAFQE